jgi:dUTP pyrophosphatase
MSDSGRKALRVARLRPDASLPSYATEDSAGLDLAACVDEPVVIPPSGFARVPTGLALTLPQGFEGQVRPRSGLAAKHGVTVLNAPGTIDADYRGEIQVLLVNHGRESFTITSGDRIAQLVVAPVARVHVEAIEAAELDETTRGAGGFGSTGV